MRERESWGPRLPLGPSVRERGPQAGPVGFPSAAPSPQQGRAASSGCLGCVCGQTGRNQPVRNLRNDTAGQWGSGGGERAAQKRSEPASRTVWRVPCCSVSACMRAGVFARVTACTHLPVEGEHLFLYSECVSSCNSVHGCLCVHTWMCAFACESSFGVTMCFYTCLCIGRWPHAHQCVYAIIIVNTYTALPACQAS